MVSRGKRDEQGSTSNMGFVWLATRPDLCGEFSAAGSILRFTVGGPWYASLPLDAWPPEEKERKDILQDFQ
jgi:hypothetical protein